MVLVLDIVPRAGRHLLHAQGDFFFFVIDIKDHHFDFLINIDQFRGMSDSTMTHVGNVQQAVDPTEVDERTEFGDVLDHAFSHLADFQFAKQLFAIFLSLFFDQRPTANDDVSSCFVDFENFALHDSTDIFANVMRTSNIDLTRREKNIDSNVDKQPAFNFSSACAGDDLTFLDRLHHLLPGENLFRLTLAEADHAVGIFSGSRGVFYLFYKYLNRAAYSRLLFFFFPFR